MNSKITNYKLIIFFISIIILSIVLVFFSLINTNIDCTDCNFVIYENETVSDVAHRLDGTALQEFLEGLDYVDETTEEKTYKNNDFDKYQQFRFDFRRTSYYIDDDGYLTVSFSDYDYSVGPK